MYFVNRFWVHFHEIGQQIMLTIYEIESTDHVIYYRLRPHAPESHMCFCYKYCFEHFSEMHFSLS